MNDGIYYVVRFNDGNYYKGSPLLLSKIKVSREIKLANLYVFDWQVAKDSYLRQFLYNRDLSYEIIKVKTTTSFEIIK